MNGSPAAQFICRPSPLGVRVFLGQRDLFVQLRLVRERSERGDQQGPCGRFQNAGVAIIDRTVQQRSRPRPGLAVVRRSHHVHTSERTHVLLSTARPNQHQFAVPPTCHRGPATVMVGQFTDRPNFVDLKTIHRCGDRPGRLHPTDGAEAEPAAKYPTSLNLCRIHRLIPVQLVDGLTN